MCAMSVIDNELEFLNTKKPQNQDEKEYVTTCIDQLQFAKTQIETQIQAGIMTPESYIA